MKKNIINENWEEIEVEDASYFYAVVYYDNVEKLSYVKTFGHDDESIKAIFDEMKNQLKEIKNDSVSLYFIKFPNTKQIAALLEKALYKGANISPECVEAVNQLLEREDVKILEIYSTELTEAKKKKKRKQRKILGGYLCWTTGCPAYNIAMFNKHAGTDFPKPDENKDAEKAAEDAAEAANDAIDAGSVSVSDGIAAPEAISSNDIGGEAAGDSGASAGEGGAMGESLDLTEAKRYVKRYYVRPQNIFCSNKEEILKALVQVGNNNCSVYSLKSLPDHDDVHLLKPSDIIYYYDDGILYDKNHVKVMDYDLFVKHEEERKKVGNIDAMSDAAFANEYEDRLTDADLSKKEIKVRKATHEDLDESITFADMKQELWNESGSVYLGYNKAYAGNAHVFKDNGVYAGTSYYAEYDDNTGEYSITCWHMSDDGDEEEGDILEFDSFEDLCKWIKAAKLEDRQVAECLKEDTIYVGKLGGNLNLPSNIHLVPQDEVESLINLLDPEEEFEVGYVNPIYLYKELWEYMPIFKCTEMRGYTGVDFAHSEDSVHNDATKRVQDARDQIKQAKETGKTFEVGSTVDYSSQNKLVARAHDTNGQTTRSTILFYPEEIMAVCYYVKLPTQPDFIKIDAKQLEQYIYDNLDKIERKMDPEKIKKKVHNTFFGKDDIDIDRETRAGDPLNTKLIYKYKRNKLQVRALYTSQIYYLGIRGAKRGGKIIESIEPHDLAEEAFEQNFKSVNGLGEAFDDVFTCCICGEETTGYGNNPEPVRHTGRCCDACNRKFVIPARIAAMKAEQDEDIEEGLNEATLSYYDQEKKMDAWHNGTRGLNIAACSDAKLKMNYDICKQKGYQNEAAQLEAEGRSRGLWWAKPQQAPQPAPKMPEEIIFTVDDFHTADALFVNDAKDTTTLINNWPHAKDHGSKDLIMALIFALCLGKNQDDFIKTLKIYLTDFCEVSETELKDIINKCLADAEIVKRLNEITKEVKSLNK